MGRKTQRMKALFSGKKQKSNVQNAPASQTGSQVSVSPSLGSNRGQVGDVAMDTIEMALKLVRESADWFGPLKAAAGGLCECIRIYRQVADNKGNFDKLAADIAERANILEQERKKEMSSDMQIHFDQLSKKLDDIHAQVLKKKDQHIALQVVQGDQNNKDIDSFFKEVQDAYEKCKDQVLFTIGRDTKKITNILENHTIQNMPYSQRAFHDVDIGNGHAREGCTPGTREKILKDIEEWADGTSPVKTLGYWICGMAGTGKSTIAKSVCDTMQNKKMLAATFFCSRQFPECRDHSKIIPTIVYQMAQFSPSFGRQLVTILQGNPDKVSKPPNEQLEMLLVEPWMKVVSTGGVHPFSPVIIIDALDECENIESVEKMYLHNVEESLVQEDIAIYLSYKLQDLNIAQVDMNKLIKSSGKLFIYAATLVKYICDPDFPDLASSKVQEMTSTNSSPDKSQTQDLDQLYSTILKKAIPEKLTPSQRKDYLGIIHTIITAGRPLTCSIISELLGMQQNLVEATISRMQSVLYVSDQLIYTFHASFADYIVTEDRSAGMYCNEMGQHTLLSHATLDHMHNLRFNICDLPSSFLADKDVPGIEGRLKNISDTLDYACTFWGYHIARSNVNKSLMKGLEIFLENKSVFWIEAMNLMRKLPVCQENIDYVLQNLKNGNEHELRTKIIDVKYVIELCLLSGSVVEATPHIYLSILPFCSEWLTNKIKLQNVMKLDHKMIHKEAIHIWESTSEINRINLACDGKTLVSGDDDGNIKLGDVFSGKEVDISIGGHEGQVNSVAFSADGKRIVSGSSDWTIRLWDTTSGGRIGDPLQGHDNRVTSVEFSTDDTMIVSGSEDRTIRLWDTATGGQIGDPLQGHDDYVNSVAFSAELESASPEGRAHSQPSSERTTPGTVAGDRRNIRSFLFFLQRTNGGGLRHAYRKKSRRIQGPRGGRSYEAQANRLVNRRLGRHAKLPQVLLEDNVTGYHNNITVDWDYVRNTVDDSYIASSVLVVPGPPLEVRLEDNVTGCQNNRTDYWVYVRNKVDDSYVVYGGLVVPGPPIEVRLEDNVTGLSGPPLEVRLEDNVTGSQNNRAVDWVYVRNTVDDSYVVSSVLLVPGPPLEVILEDTVTGSQNNRTVDWVYVRNTVDDSYVV
ncbi:hypothetical protein K435DRAFT_973529 [Dendrothele bispora CBS 962.96]|uniref:Nephrocystin 3-like N-terminal domain-containing protein n=1 Tax=Dendrothele bispora (strain CBS 962.96) TaxID=1314807 RepID=A0A4S8KSU2_DENBC|nr:hypothetical protein K435DRAFT_973529 [Dendrothele bispora CBS 962.96]